VCVCVCVHFVCCLTWGFVYNMFAFVIFSASSTVLDENFVKDLSAVPEYWTDDPAAYSRLLDKYGGFYVHGVKYGGSLVSTVASTRTVDEDRDSFGIKVDGCANFFFFKFCGTVYENTREKHTTTARDEYAATVKMEGGEADDNPATKYTPPATVNWAKSVARKPVSLGFVLRPISDLITDQRRARAFATALAVKIYKSNNPVAVEYETLTTPSPNVIARFTASCTRVVGVRYPPGALQYSNTMKLNPGGCFTVSMRFATSDQVILYVDVCVRVLREILSTRNCRRLFFCSLSPSLSHTHTHTLSPFLVILIIEISRRI
jgi:hypothetical protein